MDILLIKITKPISDSSKLRVIATTKWLVEFKQDLIKRLISEGYEFCQFKLKGYDIYMSKSKKTPTTIFYNPSQKDKNLTDGLGFSKCTLAINI
ncbi:MAG: hypothetical protein ACJASM_000234 [Salibacteraceae bacterium]|jgi:hypothetical protein|tara:strand:- start:635 stop:916 length:282 start_codon:yes stop_codon:yes gene_type:complete